MEPLLPTQRPLTSIPVVRFIFSGRVRPFTNAWARRMDFVQGPVAVTFGEGRMRGDVGPVESAVPVGEPGD